jgi:glucose-6-phosphate isomerase
MLTDLPEWRELAAHAADMRSVHLRTLFAADERRGTRFAAEAAGLYADFSKHRITTDTLRLLVRLATARGLGAHVEAMMRGDRINVTENRPVLHVALRAPRSARILVDGRNVVEDVHEVLDRMTAFADRVRNGSWTGFTGRRIRAVVNIGIGG